MRNSFNQQSPDRPYKVNSQVPYNQRETSSVHNFCDFINSKPLLIECSQYVNDLKKYNIPPNTDEALGPDTENITNIIISFLKKTYFYNKI